MLWIFRAQGVHREALAALRIFIEAARQEAATADLILRVTRFLHRSPCSRSRSRNSEGGCGGALGEDGPASPERADRRRRGGRGTPDLEFYELVTAESAAAAADDPGRARDLAELARRVAALAPGAGGPQLPRSTTR